MILQEMMMSHVLRDQHDLWTKCVNVRMDYVEKSCI